MQRARARGRRVTSSRRLIGAACVSGLLVVTACSPSDVPADQDSTRSGDDAAEGGSGADNDGGGVSADGDGSDETPTVPDGCDPIAPADGDFESVELEEIGSNEHVVVSAAIYPLAETEGNPWSQWGKGVVLADGRFVSAVGDHLGIDGTSWFYEYDPATNELSRTTEVSVALGHEAGDWGYGKIHAPMVLSECGDIITSTYWGTRRHLVLGDSYQGDQLITYDPATREVESLGVPIVGFGLPSLAISPDHRWIFGEAVDPESDPDAGVFFVADATTGEVRHIDDNVDHVGFRSILVTPDGEGMYANGGFGLIAVDPESGDTRELDDVLPGEWLRATTAIGPDGTVYGTTRDPDALFAVSPDGEFTDLGELEDYVASIEVSPDGSTLFYVPGAHGSGFELGTPLIAVDTATGERTELVRLNDLVEERFDLRAGGTFNIVVDPGGERLYIGLNAGPIDDDEDPFGEVVLAVVDLT